MTPYARFKVLPLTVMKSVFVHFSLRQVHVTCLASVPSSLTVPQKPEYVTRMQGQGLGNKGNMR